MLLKLGSTGPSVKEIQNALGITADGHFGLQTEAVVKRYQSAHNIAADGIVGPDTYNLLVDIDTDRFGFDDSIDDTDGKIDYQGTYDTDECLVIDRAYLDTDEYVRDYGKIEPVGFMYHHSAGWDNPYNMIRSWNNDKQGRVATQYGIGGLNINGNHKYDGRVVECFPDNYLGWHTGRVGNFNVSKLYGGVELNNFGYLIQKDHKFYNYVGGEVPKDQVCDLGYKFRGHQFYHKYSDDQLHALGLLNPHVARIYPKIDMTEGLPKLLKSGMSPLEAFEFNEDAYYGRIYGLWTHTNVRKDKSDCFPQPELIEMIKNIR